MEILTPARDPSSYKFSFLLVTLILFLAVSPFFVIIEGVSTLYFNVLVFLVLFGNIYATTHRLRSVIVGGLLAAASLGFFVAADAMGDQSLEVYGFAFLGLVWIYSAASILRHVLTRRVVTWDTLAGAICVYLMIGLIWAVFFIFIESVLPGSFNFTGASLMADTSSRLDYHRFTYFSFVTLTTVGYGSLLAVSPPAQGFAYIEAVFGQIYVAVLIARLMGLHLSTKVEAKES